MFRKLITIALAALITSFLGVQLAAQTTNGQITGTVTDPSGAVVTGGQIKVTNQVTSETRTAVTDKNGYYVVPQLPPGTYAISIRKQGFASEDQSNVQLQVNQSLTLDFKMTLSATSQTIQVTAAPPALDSTTATLTDVVEKDTIVGLPLNGREFTQLTLLTPGAAPITNWMQGGFTIALGAGGIAPAVDGNRSNQDNFTMDGLLNNEIFTSVWAISPPPDALEEFNVQSHITDAQFAISSGANINVVTRSGTDSFRGSAWEFIRNDALDAQQFPATSRTPYRQNQYGVFLGGPVIKNNTWFAGYWEGFRASQTLSYFGSTLTSAMQGGDFSGVLGTTVLGTDSLGRPEYANEIYDPLTSRPDPNNPGEFLRDPFPGNIIPQGRINPDATLILQRYYPSPNLNVGESVLPNLEFTSGTRTSSDVAGIRIDHRFGNSDMLFGRYNRANATLSNPPQLPAPGQPDYKGLLTNYGAEVAVGYTHLFGPNTILNLHYGWTKTAIFVGQVEAGEAFVDALNMQLAMPEHAGYWLGPGISIANGYSGVDQGATPLGPEKNMDYHADWSRVIRNHTIGAGGMFYRLHTFDDGFNNTPVFTQNATAQDATTGPTGFGPASFLLGFPDNYTAAVGNTSANAFVNWYAGYVQDQWKATRRLTLTAGLRYDYVSPASFDKIVSGLDAYTGQFIITGAVSPQYPQATGPSGYFYPQYNGYEPRFGFAYQVSNRTVFHGAFAILDDHNDTVEQKNQDMRLSWPSGANTALAGLDLGVPTVSLTNLPTASSLINTLTPFTGSGADPHDKIPYSMEFNIGIQQQLTNSMVLSLNYVASIGRHQFIDVWGNTALNPGPGPISLRQPYPQFGGPIVFDTNAGTSSYNALQAKLNKSFSHGLSFLASYTWSKSLDLSSLGELVTVENFYNLKADWGPSTFNLGQIFVLSGVYALPVGRDQRFLSNPNRFVQAVAGNWNTGSIITLHSGEAFDATVGDVANVGNPYDERAEKIGPAYGSGFQKSWQHWINPASFTLPANYTYGNESRNDLVGPPYKNVDFNVFKDISVTERAKFEIRAEFFNLFNHTNYGLPSATLPSSSFGIIESAGPAREIQFAAKVMF